MNAPEVVPAAEAKAEAKPKRKAKAAELIPVEQRAAIALGSSKTEGDLIALAESTKGIVAITNKEGREECHAAMMTAQRARTAIAAVSKAARDDAVKFSKAVIAEENRLVALIEPEEKRLKAIRDAWDEKVAAEKAEAERKERERIAAITTRIAAIRELPIKASMAKTAEVADMIADLKALDVGEGFAEFLGDATDARIESLEKMAEIYEAKHRADEEAERARREREAEAERQRIAREEQARRDAEEKARLEAERKRVDAERAENERIQREKEESLRLEREKFEAERAEFLRQQAEAAKKAEPAAEVATPVTGSAVQAAVQEEPAPVASLAVALEAIAPSATAEDVVENSPKRPSDREILDVLALHFRVHESKILEWLLDMDLAALSDDLMEAF